MYSNHVLIDNTTIYSAARAYETWPIKVDEWFQGPNSINLRSLMDILEGIVLYEKFLVDGGSRTVLIDGRFTPIWPELEEEYGFVDAIPFSMEGLFPFQIPLDTALEKLEFYLSTGQFKNDLLNFKSKNIDFVVPNFYSNPDEFGDKLLQSFPGQKLTPEVINKLKEVQSILISRSTEESNYAMFAFRGFYYVEIARLLSISYSPHTWRSSIIDTDTSNPNLNFTRYIKEVSSEIRRELATQLNSELQTDNFSTDFPVIAAYIAAQCQSRKALLRVAIDVRNSSSVSAFRNWINDVQSSIRNQSDLSMIAHARSDLEEVLADIRKELGLYDVGAVAEKVKIKIGIPPVSMEVPLSIRLGTPDWFKYVFQRKTHLLFLREITKESVSLSPFAHRYFQLEP